MERQIEWFGERERERDGDNDLEKEIEKDSKRDREMIDHFVFKSLTHI